MFVASNITNNTSLEPLDTVLSLGADVNAEDDDGWTALMYTARYIDRPDIINTLIKAGADIDAQDKYGWTALMHAIYKYNLDCMVALLNAGADANIKNNEGERAIDFKTIKEMQETQRRSSPDFGPALNRQSYIKRQAVLDLLQSKTK